MLLNNRLASSVQHGAAATQNTRKNAVQAHARRDQARTCADSSAPSTSSPVDITQPAQLSRRAFAILTGVALTQLCPSPDVCAAAEAEGVPQKLPKAYVEVVQKITKSLRESIEAERANGKETKVRRKADPAKEALQTFVKRWRDDPKVQPHPSHSDIKGVLMELSNFYQSAGPRAKMPQDVQERLLSLLASAETSLQAKTTSKPKDTKDTKPRAAEAPLSLFDEKTELEELLPKTRQ